MSVEHMPDERLVHFYEKVRQQVEVDRRISNNSWRTRQFVSMPIGCKTKWSNDD